MRILMFTCSLLASLACDAAHDSVGVFHRPHKVVILVSEGHNARLTSFLAASNYISGSPWQTEQGDFKMSCGMDSFKVGCTISLYSSDRVIIGARDVRFSIPFSELGTSSQSTLAVEFESSQKDQLKLTMESGTFSLWATKKVKRLRLKRI